MNRFILSFLAIGLVLLFVSCQEDEDPPVPYDGIIAVTGFTGVVTEGSITVNITQGSEYSVVVRDDATAFDRITAEINESGDLVLASFLSTDSPTIDVVMPFFDQLRAVDNSTMLVSDFSSLTGLQVEAYGVSSITITNSTAEGAFFITAERGEINAFGLTLEEVNCESFSSKDISITVTEGLGAFIFGAGNVNYKGTPDEVFVFSGNTGSGQVVNAN